MKSIQPFMMTIGGVDVAGVSTFPVINPATGAVFAQAPECSRQQLDDAVTAARLALPNWAATPFAERQKILISLAGVLLNHVDELKLLLTQEQGKPHGDAAAEIQSAASRCKSTALFELPRLVIEDSLDRWGETRRVPLGVVGAIAPWNFPISLAMMKVAPALLAGNTVVLKPSPFTPLTTLRLGHLMQSVLPVGVLNVVSGGDELGPWMTTHPGIDKIGFTGSTGTGRKVMASSAATLKRITLELGGNDAAIVLPDINVQQIVEKLFWAAFRNNGQICMAAKRVYVHRDVYEALKIALVAYANTIRVGDGSEQDTQLGPLQNLLQYRRVLDLIEDSKRNGHKFALAGDPPSSSGYFVHPTIIDNPPEDARIVQEEQFGPIMPLMVFDDIDDVVDRANSSPYGLCASIWSGDVDRALEIGSRLQVGTIWVNEAHYLSPFAPFGGHKQSGLGVEGSKEVLLEYTNAQTIFVRKTSLASTTPRG
jgi:acyl-CoA reductase-like NAD-dependent aldehyde dehydrogenase